MFCSVPPTTKQINGGSEKQRQARTINWAFLLHLTALLYGIINELSLAGFFLLIFGGVIYGVEYFVILSNSKKAGFE